MFTFDTSSIFAVDNKLIRTANKLVNCIHICYTATASTILQMKSDCVAQKRNDSV